MKLREAIWRVAVSEFSSLVPRFSLPGTRGVPGSPWSTDARTRSRRACGVLFPLPSPVVCLADEEPSIKLFHNSSFDRTLMLLFFRRTQQVLWLEYSCVGRFLYLFSKGVLAKVEYFTLLGRERGTDGELLLPETLLELSIPGCQKIFVI